MQILPLEPHHEGALHAFLADFDAAGEPVIPAYFAPRDTPIEQIVEEHRAEQAGERSAPMVPASTRFAIGDDGAVLGVYNARHVLNDRLRVFGGHVGFSVRPSARGQGVATQLLRHAIGLLRGLGTTSILVTCDPTNIASARVIERCGGVQQDRSYSDEHGHEISRYWID
tara:strand:- start:3300 stop:3809 length:510 start_codon:yes stop_codon:yes gene_type:complete